MSSSSFHELHPIERRVAQLLEAGDEVTVAALGGFNEIASAVERLGSSPLMPELLPGFISYGRDLDPAGYEPWRKAFTDLIANVSDEFTLIEMIDALDALRPLPTGFDEVCFTVLLSKTEDKSLTGLARGIAIEGAFRWAVLNRRWQFRLLDYLLGIVPTDDEEFLRRAAKICGIAHSYWNENSLIARLEEFARVDYCLADASFELGMAGLMEGLDSTNRRDATSAFEHAQTWFEISIRGSEASAEAQLYSDCLKLISSYDADARIDDVAVLASKVSVHAFELKAWAGSPNSPWWLGRRRLEAVYWNQLALSLNGLLHHLGEASWWEPAAVIEQYLLAVYTSSRTLLRKTDSGGLDEVIRPRIAGTLARQEGQAYSLKTWVRHNLQHEWAEEANQLLAEVDRLVTIPDAYKNPSEAALAGTTIVALIDKSYLPTEIKERLSQVVSNAVALHIDNMTQAEVEIITGTSEAAGHYRDYRDNPHGRRLFDAILLWLVRFLHNRLEITKADDPTVGYLFKRDDRKQATESLLQDDFYRWLTTNLAGSDIEATNVSGGRADIRVRSSNERIVVEVKRELKNSDFESLAASYQAQATDYQNVSVRLGFLLVLDLVSTGNEGTPHISNLVRVQSVRRAGEDSPRLLVIVKVPGNRNRPSDLTKAVKSRATISSR